jgi:hypothetical protein
VVLSDRKMKRIFFNQLLICLAVFDIIFLICCLNESFRKPLEGGLCSLEGHQKYILLVLYPARQIAMLGSIYMTIIMAYERYIALATLFSDRAIKFGFPERNRVLKVVSVVVLGSFIYNFPWFFVFTIEEQIISHNKTNSTMNCLALTEFRDSENFILWYVNIANLIVTGAIPFLCLVIFNCRIITMIRYLSKERENLDINGAISTRNDNQRKNQKLQERNNAIVLIVIAIAFLLFHSLRIILNLEEIFTYEEKKTLKADKNFYKMCQGDQFWTAIAGDYSQLLLVFNSSINFFVYGLFGKQFKEVMKEKLLDVGWFFCSCDSDGENKQDGTSFPLKTVTSG